MLWVLLSGMFAYMISLKTKRKSIGILLCIPSSIIAAIISSTAIYFTGTRNAGETLIAIISNSVFGFILSIIVLLYCLKEIKTESKNLSYDFGDFTIFLEGDPNKEKVQEYATALHVAGAKKEEILVIIKTKLGPEFLKSIHL